MNLASADDVRQRMLLTVAEILTEMTADWDLDFSGGIRPETMLIADLAFESIDVVEFVVGLEERFERRDLPFEDLLMTDGRYVDDLSVSQVVDFLLDHCAVVDR